MRKKLVIFPHAGAIRSNYQVLEGILKARFDVVFIDYEKLYKQYNIKNMDQLVEQIKILLKDILGNEKLPAVFYGHSMGTYVLYALSSFLTEHYGVDKLVYSDVRPPQYYHTMELANMDKFQQNQILENQYEFSEEVRAIPPLFEYFKGRLLEDLLILDTMEEYNFQKPVISKETKVLLLYSDYSASESLIDEWNQSIQTDEKMKSFYFKGGHYYFAEHSERTAELISS